MLLWAARWWSSRTGSMTCSPAAIPKYEWTAGELHGHRADASDPWGVGDPARRYLRWQPCGCLLGVLTEASLRSWLEDAVGRSGIPGASVAVLVGDELLTATAGVLNVETLDPVTPDAVFQIGSTMKVITAALVMQLVDEGAVALNAPVHEYLPELRSAEDIDGVTVRRLLDHSSGLPGNYFEDFGRGDDSIERYVAALLRLPRAHRAGSMFSYCNGGYVVAGRLLEVVTGMSFRDVVSNRLSVPLGLSATTTRIEDVYGRRQAAGHEPNGSGQHRVHPVQLAAWSSIPAGSQAVSTAAELATFARIAMSPAADQQSVLSTTSASLMATPSCDLPCPYWGRRSQGLGWGVDERDGRTVLLHGGGTTGQAAMMLGVPDSDTTIVVLTNSAAGAALLAPAEAWLLEQACGIGPATSPPPPADDLDRASVSRVLGTYAEVWTVRRVELDERGALFMYQEVLPSPLAPAGHLPPVQLRQIDERTFRAGAGRPVVFLDDFDDPDAPAEYLHQMTVARRVPLTSG